MEMYKNKTITIPTAKGRLSNKTPRSFEEFTLEKAGTYPVVGSFDLISLSELNYFFRKELRNEFNIEESDGQYGRYIKLLWWLPDAKNVAGWMNISIYRNDWLSRRFTEFLDKFETVNSGPKPFVKGAIDFPMTVYKSLKNFLNFKREIPRLNVDPTTAAKLFHRNDLVIAKEIGRPDGFEDMSPDDKFKSIRDNWNVSKGSEVIWRFEFIENDCTKIPYGPVVVNKIENIMTPGGIPKYKVKLGEIIFRCIDPMITGALRMYRLIRNNPNEFKIFYL
jgi:hypothetical protein